MRKIIIFTVIATLFISCTRVNKADQYRADKHVRDSVSLVEQERSLAFYESQLELLTPKADSLLQYFKYERNEKYQDHGYYVVKNSDLRVMVRDDGKEILAYRNGKRVELPPDNEALVRAQHLQIVISDIKECEKRIQRTSLEIQKYQKRLQKSH
jgi:hypothetical protein